MKMRWIVGLGVLFMAFGVLRLYYHLTDDFRFSNITYEFPFEAPWKSEPLSAEKRKELTDLLHQRFSYIGKGAQCYAFASEDNRYVLKFFKFKHLKPNWFVQFLPESEFKKNYYQKKLGKLTSLFDGYELAYKEDRDDTAMIYLHLGPTEDLKTQATLIDKMGFERHIDLDPVVFLIQRKGETFRTRLRRLLTEKNLEGAKQAIDQILTMYISEYQKGIYDRDHGVMTNTGFVDDHPFHLDAGKFSKIEAIKDKSVYKEDLELVLWKMNGWIQESFPEFYPSLSTYLADSYYRLTGTPYESTHIHHALFKTRREELMQRQ